MIKWNGLLVYLFFFFREMVLNYMLESIYIMINFMYFFSGMEKGILFVFFEISLRLFVVKFLIILIFKMKIFGIDGVLFVMFCSLLI